MDMQPDERASTDERQQDAGRKIIGRLEAEVSRRESARQLLEERWLNDIRAYHGKWAPDQQERAVKAQRSKVSLAATRPRTDLVAARLFDLLHPVDDRNWDIEATPVPELDAAAEEAAHAVADARLKLQRAGNEQEQQQASLHLAEVQAEEERVAAMSDAARRRIDAMRREMADQLAECRYERQCRRVTEDAALYGIGWLRGPLAHTKLRERWVEDTESGEMILDQRSDPKPIFRRVSPWHCFPDPDHDDVWDGEGVFERHLLNRKALRRLAKLPGFNREAISRLLESKPSQGWPQSLHLLRAITGDHHQLGEHWLAWEYEGPLDGQDVIALARLAGNGPLAAETTDQIEVDTLLEVHVVVWWSGAEILKIETHPYDSGICTYSSYRLVPEPMGPYALGVPALIRDPQAMLSATARAIMDNSAYAAGPQVVINKEAVEPLDGNWSPSPWKVWLEKGGVIPPAGSGAPPPPIRFVQPDANLAQLLPIAEFSLRLIDIISGIHTEQMGEPGVTPQQTATGTALLISSANVVYRRWVRNYDDDLTIPSLKRLYHWNMQFNRKPGIRGDYDIVARGASVLMVRELQAQNLIAILNLLGPDDPDVKVDEIKAELFRSLLLRPDGLMRSPGERAEWMEQQAAAAANAPEMEMKARELDLREQEIAAKIAVAEMTEARRLEAARLRYDEAMTRLAEALNMDERKLRAMLSDNHAERESKERVVAAEVAMKQASGQSAGGYV